MARRLQSHSNVVVEQHEMTVITIAGMNRPSAQDIRAQKQDGWLWGGRSDLAELRTPPRPQACHVHAVNAQGMADDYA